MLFGENAIITQTQIAKESTRGGEVQETVDIAITENELANYSGETVKTKEDVIKELQDAGKLTDDEVALLKTKGKITIGNVEVDFSVLPNKGEIVATEDDETENYIIKDEDELKEKISDLGYVGYYADIDNNGTVDGIIYTDLAVSVSGQWTDDDGNFSYNKVSNLKDYTISSWVYKGQTTAGIYDDVWGEKGVIVPAKNSSGTNDRFYVMDLEDYDDNWYYWFYADDCDYVTSEDFGKGKENTKAVISIFWNCWDEKSEIESEMSEIEDEMYEIQCEMYEIQCEMDEIEDQDSEEYISLEEQYNSLDGEYWDLSWQLDNFYICDPSETVWNIFKGIYLVETEYTVDPDVWFVPSREEWCAFAVNLGVTTDNYVDLDLNYWYWSSSQYFANNAYAAFFSYGYINYNDYCGYSNDFVRLSATF